MWRCDRLLGEQPQRVDSTWHDTEADALAAQANTTGIRTLVWFDAFDYELHNQGRAA